MPNKRAEDKGYLSAWIDAELKDELKKLADERGCSMSDIVNGVVREEVAKYKTKKDGHEN